MYVYLKLKTGTVSLKNPLSLFRDYDIHKKDILRISLQSSIDLIGTP